MSHPYAVDSLQWLICFQGSNTTPNTPSSTVQPFAQDDIAEEARGVGRVLTPDQDPFRKDDISVEGEVGAGERGLTPTPVMEGWREMMDNRRSWETGKKDKPSVQRSMTVGHRHQHQGSADTVKGLGLGLSTLNAGGIGGKGHGDDSLEEIGEWAVKSGGGRLEHQQERWREPNMPFVFPAHPYAVITDTEAVGGKKADTQKERRRPLMTIRPVAYREMQRAESPLPLTSTSSRPPSILERAAMDPLPYAYAHTPRSAPAHVTTYAHAASTSRPASRATSPVPPSIRRVGSPLPSPRMRAASPSPSPYMRATSPLPSPTKWVPPPPGPPPSIGLPSVPEPAQDLQMDALVPPVLNTPVVSSLPLAPSSPPAPVTRAATPIPASAPSSPQTPKRPPRSPRRRVDSAVPSSPSVVPFPTLPPVEDRGVAAGVAPLVIKKCASADGGMKIPKRPATADDVHSPRPVNVAKDRDGAAGQSDRPPTPFPMLSLASTTRAGAGKEKQRRPHTAEGRVRSLQERQAWGPKIEDHACGLDRERTVRASKSQRASLVEENSEVCLSQLIYARAMKLIRSFFPQGSVA